MITKFLTYLEVERHYSLLTVDAYRRDLEAFCDFLGVEVEALDTESVTTDQVRDWLLGDLDQGMSPRSVRRHHSSLRSFWKFLLRTQQTQQDPTARIILPKLKKALPVFYRESEMERAQVAEEWADDFESVRDSLIIEMLYETGMRRAELVGLDDKDVSKTEKQIRVFGKRKKERIIPIGDALLERILLYKQYRDEVFGTNRQEVALFVSNKGKRIGMNAIYNIVRARMSEVSTLSKQSPHVLRHTFATTMLNNGADINTIKALMGHASLAATQVYTHTSIEQMKKAYKRAHPRSKKD